MSRLQVALLLAAVLGAAGLVAFLGPRPTEPPGAGPGAVAVDARAQSAEIASLRLALEQESFEREMLAAEVELMRAVIEQIALERSEEVSAALAEEASADPTPAAARGSAGRPGLDEEALLEIGLVEQEVRELRDRWDEAQLAKLELNDRATREGWLARPRHRRQTALLDQELRTELGEGGYDQMLFATGQPNRVVVNTVIGGSAAAIAGIQPGDRVISYGSERVFTPKDVRRATVSGRKGEIVRVVVERGSSTHTFTVPRGPIGIHMGRSSGAPEP